MIVFVFGVHYFLYNHLEEKKRAGCFALTVLRMSCNCEYSVALPQITKYVYVLSIS